MGRFALSLLSFLMYVSLSAQEVSGVEAQKLMADVSNRMDAYESLRVDFVMDVIVPGESESKEKGYLIQQKENFIFDLESQTIYSDGTAVWVHIKKDDEVQINDPDFGDDGSLMSPGQIMRLYETEEFIYDIVNEDAKMVEVEFKPTEDLSDYSKIRLTVNTDKTQLEKIEMFYKDGMRINMSISEFVINDIYSPETFTFDAAAFPGVYVEDLRID